MTVSLTPSFAGFSENLSSLPVVCKVQKFGGVLAQKAVELCKRYFRLHLSVVRDRGSCVLAAHAQISAYVKSARTIGALLLSHYSAG